MKCYSYSLLINLKVEANLQAKQLRLKFNRKGNFRVGFAFWAEFQTELPVNLCSSFIYNDTI